MKTVEILRIIQKHNPNDIPRNSDINSKIRKDLKENNIDNVTLNDLWEQSYIKCKITWTYGNVRQWIWLTAKWKNEIERHYWIEAENRNLKQKIQELEKEIRTNKSLLRHPLFVWISSAIVTAFLAYIITN